MKDLLVFHSGALIARLRVDSISADPNGNITVMETYGLDDRQAVLPMESPDSTNPSRIALANEFAKLPYNLGEIIEWCTDNGAELILEDAASKAPSQVLVGDAVAFLTASLDPGVVSVAYSEEISVATPTGGSTIKIIEGTLPAGLTLSGNTIAGTPTTAGTYVFKLRLIDSNYNDFFVDKQYTIIITAE